jgi:hypothetical protein
VAKKPGVCRAFLRLNDVNAAQMGIRIDRYLVGIGDLAITGENMDRAVS